MSYEGYTQLICANGHYDTIDAYDSCGVCDCGAKFIHIHSVDTTNDSGEPREIIETKPIVLFDIKNKLERLGILSIHENNDEVAALIKEILANVVPKMIEPPLVKFGEIIKLKRDENGFEVHQ